MTTEHKPHSMLPGDDPEGAGAVKPDHHRSAPTIDGIDWNDRRKRAGWSTARQETRMGKSGYAPRKAELAKWVIEAIDRMEGLEEQVREALSEIAHAERCVTEERKRRIGSMNMTMEGLADDLRRAREALGG